MACILGLTGSIGSGKSFVTSCMERLGAVAIRADDLAREVVAPGTPAYQEILEDFGPTVASPGGELDRKRLARIVFSDPKRRRRLEEIVHPRVRERELELIRLHSAAPLIVLEIPLLFETDAQTLCDKVLVVTIGEEERLRRLAESRGMAPEEIRARLEAQMPQEEKVRRADFVIDNSGSREATREAAEQLYRALTRNA